MQRIDLWTIIDFQQLLMAYRLQLLPFFYSFEVRMTIGATIINLLDHL